jgi:hypothetical protein
LWLPVSRGIAAGLGRLTAAAVAGVFAFLILTVLGHLERRFSARGDEPPGGKGQGGRGTV